MENLFDSAVRARYQRGIKEFDANFVRIFYRFDMKIRLHKLT